MGRIEFNKSGENRIHWQNLCEDIGNPNSSIFWHGRWWLHLWRSVTYAAWLWGRKQHHLHFRITWDDEDGYGFSFAIPWIIAIWFSFYHPRLPRIKKWGYWTVFAICIHREYIFLDLWNDDWHYPSARHISINWKNMLFGKARHEQREVSKHQGSIMLIEGEYKCDVTMTEHSWSRPRLPGKRTVMYADIKPDKPLPIPGKGENSWDMDEDAIYEASLRASTPQEALQKERESILKRRERYGGKHWQPRVNA